MASNCAINHLNSECQNCQMHIAHSAGSSECLMEVIRSQWQRPFGDTRYCEHPAASQFVDFVNSGCGLSADDFHDASLAA